MLTESGTARPSSLPRKPDFAAALSECARLPCDNSVSRMLKLAQVPGLVNFGGGLPAPELFPMEDIARASRDVLERYGYRAVQYGMTEGWLPLREKIAAQTPGLSVDNVQITSGSQQALDLLGKILIDKGDTVLVESPTYMGALQSFHPYQPRYQALPTDEEGIDMDALEQVLEDLERRGQQAKFIYVIPNFQNPTGRTMSLERRYKLLELSLRYGVLILEDDPYGELYFERERLPHLYDLALAQLGDPEQVPVLYCSTFSKTLAPGLRDAWVQAATPIIQKLVQVKQGADMHSPTLNQMIVAELMDDVLPRQIVRLRGSYRERATHMLAAMSREFPADVTYTVPDGGMFLWVSLPGSIDTDAMLPRAVENGVAYMVGSAFFALEGGRNSLRLCFSNAGAADIDRGIAGLAAAIRDEQVC
ncbi:PLP-dependent aminotransferase family protein [Deinococcus lacus]|uniref:PLP-dependent aminotransferase family protein n=1 Tax=Deinococcus lacus TaxID=392561 RepID=A0ABW1YEX6_9DEIO